MRSKIKGGGGNYKERQSVSPVRPTQKLTVNPPGKTKLSRNTCTQVRKDTLNSLCKYANNINMYNLYFTSHLYLVIVLFSSYL